MNFGFTEEQNLLRDQVRRFLDEKCPLDAVREIMKDEPCYSNDQWLEMASLGWLGLLIPPETGGVGLGWVDLIVVLEEMGRSLYPSPFTGHVLVAAALTEYASEEQQRQWLPEMASGSSIATLALLDDGDWPSVDNIRTVGQPNDKGWLLSGTKRFVSGAAIADRFLIAYRDASTEGELKLAIVDRDQAGLVVTSARSMDQTKPTGTITFNNLQVNETQLLGGGAGAVNRILDMGSVAVTAEMIGSAESVLKMTCEYANTRVQFGHPIGKYQGVKHRLAEMYVDVESFKSLTYYAAWCADENPSELPRAASLAKAYASDAFAQIGIDGVHLHGAIGYTAEYDMQLYLKRSKWSRPIFGDSDFHYDRVVQMGGH